MDSQTRVKIIQKRNHRGGKDRGNVAKGGTQRLGKKPSQKTHRGLYYYEPGWGSRGQMKGGGGGHWDLYTLTCSSRLCLKKKTA